MPFVKVMQKLHKEHLLSSSSTTEIQSTLACLISSFHTGSLFLSFSLPPSLPHSPSLSLAVSELLQLSVDMCKLRVTAMPQDCRKAFFNILTSLIEKSTDLKLLKAIARTVDDWIKNRVSVVLTRFDLTDFSHAQYDLPSHASPSLREKSLLLSRMMSFFEKRFPDDLELMSMFLDIVLFVYK